MTGLNKDTQIRLNNGVKIPASGLGTYLMRPGRETEQAVTNAIGCGYRLVDTATLYANEQSVGKAVKESELKREEVFVTTIYIIVFVFSALFKNHAHNS